MDLSNFERRANSGAPLVGALVQLFAATATDPTTILQSAFTDANGFWSFTGLAQALYDIKVNAPGSGYVKWYKGMVKIGVDQIAVGGTINLAPGSLPLTTLAHVGANNVLKSDGTQNVGAKIVAADITPRTITGASVGANMNIAFQTIYGGQAGGNSNIAPGSILGTDLVTGTLLTAQISTGGQIAKRQLSYIAATDLWNGTGFGAGSGWVDFCAYQAFPIDEAAPLTMVVVRSSAYLANYTGECMTRLVVDGVFVAPLGGTAGATGTNAQGNPFSGAGPVFVTGLAPGTHNVKVQILTNGTITNLYCRCAGQPNVESFAMEVVEFKR